MIRNASIGTALLLLLHAAPAQSAAPVCGDVNTSGSLTSSDALLVLKGAVGQPVTLKCPANDELATCTTDLSTTNADLGTCEDDLGTCLDALTACESGSGGGGGLPATGQTVCYNIDGDVVTCTGSGHDGEFQAGVARTFTDNGDGTVTDNATGLTWEKLSDDNGLHDKDAFYLWEVAIAAKLDELNFQNFGGHNDWRMPNRLELESILNLQAFSPATFTAFNNNCAPGCTVTQCSCTRGDQYWTSTTYQHFPSIAWTVTFYDGFVSEASKTAGKYVRAVRGGL